MWNLTSLYVAILSVLIIAEDFNHECHSIKLLGLLFGEMSEIVLICYWDIKTIVKIVKWYLVILFRSIILHGYGYPTQIFRFPKTYLKALNAASIVSDHDQRLKV